MIDGIVQESTRGGFKPAQSTKCVILNEVKNLGFAYDIAFDAMDPSLRLG